MSLSEAPCLKGINTAKRNTREDSGLGLRGFLGACFLSFAMVGGICFLLLVSLLVEGLLKGFSHYLQTHVPGGLALAVTVYLLFDIAAVVLLFAIIFKFCRVQWRDIWVGAR